MQFSMVLSFVYMHMIREKHEETLGELQKSDYLSWHWSNWSILRDEFFPL